MGLKSESLNPDTAVRLKVEEDQLVSVGRRLSFGGIELQGA
jgi:hypothetical protein